MDGCSLNFCFVSFFSCSFLSSVFFFVSDFFSSIRARKNTRPEKRNRTPHLDRERERESREIKMVTPLVKTNKIKKKPNGFTRYQSDTAKRVSVRLFFECISTSRDVSLCPLIPTGERHGEVFVVLEDKCVCEVEKRDAKA